MSPLGKWLPSAPAAHKCPRPYLWFAQVGRRWQCRALIDGARCGKIWRVDHDGDGRIWVPDTEKPADTELKMTGTREELDQDAAWFEEGPPDRVQRLKREIRERAAELCGWADDAETTADGSADNDLAIERADALMKTLDYVARSNMPEGIVPLGDDAEPGQRLQAIRSHLTALCAERGPSGALKPGVTARVEQILAFISLARTHPDVKRLMPRGDRVGDWLPPGTVVNVLGKHPGVVVPALDLVRVQLEGQSVAIAFPRSAVAKEGEPWTPPKPTSP